VAEPMRSHALRDVAAICAIGGTSMLWIGNPYHLPEQIMGTIGLIVVILSATVLIYDFWPWRWLGYRRAERFFIGRWSCDRLGCDLHAGNSAYMHEYFQTLHADHTVHMTHVPHITGAWEYSDGAVRISTNDGWRQIMRRTPEGVIKFAYNEQSGPLSDSSPTNFSWAEKLPN